MSKQHATHENASTGKANTAAAKGRETAPAAASESPPVQAGNRAMQALLAQHAAPREPAGADALRRDMGVHFGMSFAGLRLRTDAPAAQTAGEAGAQAYAKEDEIGFAPGAYTPETAAGRLRIAHEFAHVAQRRGGNGGSAWSPLPNVSLAEWQARRAAWAVVHNTRPVVTPFAQRASLYDKGGTTAGSGAAPVLASTNDEELLATVLKMLESLPAGEQRRGAISFLTALAVRKGPAQPGARTKMIALLAGIPNKSIDDHMAAVAELKSWVGKDVEAYDLLLYGRYWYADRSKGEIGSALVVDAFRRYLHYDGGKWAILFFQSRINGDDKFKANLAARIVADLLEGENEPAEAKYRACYSALRAMARANGWESYGPLAVASATPRIFSALAGMRQQARALRLIILRGPTQDPRWEAECDRLETFANALDVVGLQSATGPQGVTRLFYTAENREETEHALMAKPPREQGEASQEMARALTIALDAGARLAGRIEVLQSNALALDQVLGKEAAGNSDERMALFDLRQEYIDAWLAVDSSTFGLHAAGIAAGYQAGLDAVDRHFENFDQVIARRKFKSARARYTKYAQTWNEGNLAYPGNDQLDEKFFFSMRVTLQAEKKSLDSGFALGASATVGNMQVVLAPSDDFIPTDLRQVAALDRDTSIFGLQSALFLFYATDLSIHNVLIKSEIGSAGFRALHGLRLVQMRNEMEQAWNKGDFDSFLKKVDGYTQSLKSVAEAIKDRAKIDFLINLGITLVAALVTEGAAFLALRLSLLPETLALARTARAIASIGTLAEIGVFTTSELILQKVFFGKDITLPAAVKSFATNLAFVGIVKAIGTLFEPLAKGGNLRRLLVGHAIGFSGVAVASTTLTRIETGQWPPDIAMFLSQTAITYVLIAGMHHTFQELVAKPALFEAAVARGNQLVLDNRALADALRERVYSGTLTRSEGEAMRAERVRLIEEARALFRVLKDGALISATELAEVNKMCDTAIANVAGVRFANAVVADPVIRSLPAPDSVQGVMRVDESDTYVYNPAKPRAALDTMLARYRDKGFTVAGNAALMRVADPTGRTRFLLSSAPASSPRLLLPAGSGADFPASDALSRATGVSGAQLVNVRADLSRINREAESKLAAEYPDHTVLATLAMLVEQSSTITPGWKIDPVRGLADALSLERGIPRSAVRRLFLAVDPNKLPDLFAAFHSVSNSPIVAPGCRYLIADDLLPKNSVTLIDAWRSMQEKRLELPVDMDLRAVRGLARQIASMPGGWMQWLAGLPKEQRASRLRALSGLTDPRVHLPENVTELLASISADIPGHTGLNPLAGANAEEFVKLIEGKPGAGKFDAPVLRLSYVSKVERLRLDVALLEQASSLVHGPWENIVGRANEVRKTAVILLQGATILDADRPFDPKSWPKPNIDLAAFPLPGGGKVINARPERDVHLDLLFKEAGGVIVALEMTTAELTLPDECAVLDPQDAAYGGDVDAAALELKAKTSPNVRKWLQFIKIYQLRKMALAIGSAWSGQPSAPTALRVQAGDFSARAARALEDMKFQLELADGTIETAAQVAARKKPGQKKP
jgi:hypothetical protein